MPSCRNEKSLEGLSLVQVNGEPQRKKSFWNGRLIDFYCGNRENGDRCNLIGWSTVSTISMIVSSLFLSRSLFGPEIEPTTLILTGCTLAFVIGGSIISECMISDGFRRTISPTLLITAALVISSTTLLMRSGHAKNEMGNYFNSQRWAEQAKQELQRNCSAHVVANAQKYTTDACVVCDESTNWFYAQNLGPYQSRLFGLTYMNIENCPWPTDGRNITVSANMTLFERNYLCGVPFPSEGTSVSLELARCVMEYAEAWCLYAPLVLNGRQLIRSDGLFYTFSGFSSAHNYLLQHCLPDGGDQFCSLITQCDTEEASAYYQTVENQYTTIRNNTLSYPYDANKTLSNTERVSVPLISSSIAFGFFSCIYEMMVARYYLLNHS